MRFLDVRRAFAVAVLAFASATNVATAGERIEKVCAYSNNAVGIATATGSGVVAAAGGIASALGWGAVAHSSGAAIATASGSYVAGTLGVGGTVLAVVTAPATKVNVMAVLARAIAPAVVQITVSALATPRTEVPVTPAVSTQVAVAPPDSVLVMVESTALKYFGGNAMVIFPPMGIAV